LYPGFGEHRNRNPDMAQFRTFSSRNVSLGAVTDVVPGKPFEMENGYCGVGHKSESLSGSNMLVL
jgi:hypothetical protein